MNELSDIDSFIISFITPPYAEQSMFQRELLIAQVISWDESKQTVDTNHEDGRSYISAVSERIYDPNQKCNGTAKVWNDINDLS